MRCPNCLVTGVPLVVEVLAPRVVRFEVHDASAPGGLRLFDSRSGEGWDVRASVLERLPEAGRQYVECPGCGPIECEVILPEELGLQRHTLIVNPEAGD